MSLTSLPANFGKGGSNLTDGTLHSIIKELQGLNISHVAGAAANTKISIAAMRTEDTIIAALVEDGTSGITSGDDKANITIQATKASGTLTFTGAPTNNQTCVVNGTTYTAKTAVSAAKEFKIGANVTATALALANAINVWETRNNRTPDVVATPVAGVVTITSVIDGAGNATVAVGTAVTLAETNETDGSSTFTPATAVADDTATVNGVTFTAKADPVGDQQFDVKGTDLAQGIELARAINAYEFRHGTLGVTATAHPSTGVVTVTPKYKSGNIVTLTEGLSNCSASGSGYLANGTNTGGIKSSTDLTGKALTVFWFNKQ